MNGRIIAAALAATAFAHAADPAQAAPPDPAQCPRLAPREDEGNDRQVPLVIPQNLAAIARANRDRIAVATLGGGVHCLDTRSMTQAGSFGLSSDRRFLSFRWSGYEAGGFILVDRTGRGQDTDTGARPTFSPSRRRFAAIEISESGFGSLNGFAVWQVEASGFRRLSFRDDLPQMADWRIDGWTGESCIALSAFAMDKYPENAADVAKVPRTRFIARPGPRGWGVTRAAAGCPRA